MSEKEQETLVLTVAETSKLLRISINQVYLGLRSGEIPCFKVGRRYLIPKSALERKLIDSVLNWHGKLGYGHEKKEVQNRK